MHIAIVATRVVVSGNGLESEGIKVGLGMAVSGLVTSWPGQINIVPAEKMSTARKIRLQRYPVELRKSLKLLNSLIATFQLGESGTRIFENFGE